MSIFTRIDRQSATPEQVQILDRAEVTFGMVPNLVSTLAEAPAAATAYLDLNAAFASSSFSSVEQQVVALTASRLNGCTYCMAAESAVAKMVGADDATLQALREGSALPTDRLQALADFTEIVVERRGWAGETAVSAFISAGFTKAQVLEVVLGVTKKTLSNYANHIAETELDAAFAPMAWERGVTAGV